MKLDIDDMTKVQLVTKIIEIEPKYADAVSKLYAKTNEYLRRMLTRMIKEKEQKK